MPRFGAEPMARSLPSVYAPEMPTLAGYSVALGNGVVHVRLDRSDGSIAVGGTLSHEMARRLARTLLKVAGEETD